MLDFKLNKSEYGSNCGYLRQFQVRCDLPYLGEHADTIRERIVCVMEQGVGHCCGATMLGTLDKYGFWNNKAYVQEFIDYFYKLWKDACYPRDKSSSAVAQFIVGGFFVYLSDETIGYDKALRNHPDMKLVTKFNNRSNGRSYTGREISLYHMEFV